MDIVLHRERKIPIVLLAISRVGAKDERRR
jgi:hypothetical protein